MLLSGLTMQREKPLNVSALIVTRNNSDGVTEILNVRAHNKSIYGFPGGKMEDDETPEQAIVRETIEELGAEPTHVHRLGTYTALTPESREITMHVFSGTVTGDIAPNAEIAELHWMTHQQMADNAYLLTPMTLDHVMPLLENL